MQQYSNGNLDFEFIDPSNNKELAQSLAKQGFPSIPVTVQTSATETENKQLFPYALMRYRDKEQYIDLLKGAAFPNGQIDFIKAESDLEYKLVSPMRNLIREQKGVVAILQGHGEPPIEEMGEWITAIQNGYEVFTYDMHKNAGNALAPTLTPEKMAEINKDVPDNLKFRRGIDVVVIAQPQKPFTEREKYELDQYLMRGGSIFWLMNQQNVDMDMYEKRSTLTQLRELNLDDMFLKYGFKLNYNLIQDLSCEKTEFFQEGPEGGKFSSAPWIFFPLAFTLPQHPISRNVDQVLMRYVSSIDTFSQKDVKKSVFLTSSAASRTVDGQQFIDLSKYLSEKPPVALFKKGNRITGLLVEGFFTSLFANREAPLDSLATKAPTATFGARSGVSGKIVMLSDGEFFKGQNFRGKRGYIPYDNKAMLMNVIDYLAGDDALTNIRSKDVEVRTMDKKILKESAGLVRALNLILPILTIVLFGLLRFYLRKRKNERLKA
jgi:ABC-2 type transport system permease protein